MTLPLPHLRSERTFVTLAAIELSSIAAGIEVLDAVLKEAPVDVLVAQPSSPGKYLLLFTGEVDEAARSLRRGIEIANDTLIDDVLLPAAHASLNAALTPRGSRRGMGPAASLPALGVLETMSAPSLLGAVDTAVKTGETAVEAIHLLGGIGGKATALISGDVESVRVAIDAGAAFALDRKQLVRKVLIPRPDPGMLPFLAAGGHQTVRP